MCSDLKCVVMQVYLYAILVCTIKVSLFCGLLSYYLAQKKLGIFITPHLLSCSLRIRYGVRNTILSFSTFLFLIFFLSKYVIYSLPTFSPYLQLSINISCILPLTLCLYHIKHTIWWYRGYSLVLHWGLCGCHLSCVRLYNTTA